MLLQFGVIFLGAGVLHNVPFLVWTTMSLTLGYVAWILWESRRARVELQHIREEEVAKGSPERVKGTGPWRHLSFNAAREYRSRWTLLGWPLVHIAHGEPTIEPSKRTVARGWIALGERAVGLIACGGIAVGGIAFGGVAVGPFAFGGLSLGVIGLGGFVLAIWAYGGAAIGWISFGGLAVAQKLAFGGFALSRAFAIGGYALAPHVDDAAARAAAASSTWIRLASWPWFPVVVPMTIVVVFTALGLLHARMRRGGDRAVRQG